MAEVWDNGPLHGQSGTVLSAKGGWCVVKMDDGRTIVVSDISKWAKAVR